jgi:hypothetical protein
VQQQVPGYSRAGGVAVSRVKKVKKVKARPKSWRVSLGGPVSLRYFLDSARLSGVSHFTSVFFFLLRFRKKRKMKSEILRR